MFLLFVFFVSFNIFFYFAGALTKLMIAQMTTSVWWPYLWVLRQRTLIVRLERGVDGHTNVVSLLPSAGGSVLPTWFLLSGFCDVVWVCVVCEAPLV